MYYVHASTWALTRERALAMDTTVYVLLCYIMLRSGDLIEEIHANWKGNYTHLEMHHGYIQWLFPIRERGLNWHAQELQSHEIMVIHF